MSSDRLDSQNTMNLNTFARPQVVNNSFWKRLTRRFRILPRLLKVCKLQKMVLGLEIAQVVYVTAKLGLADHLSRGAKSSEELAAEMSVNVKVLSHFMPLLAELGFVAADKNGKYKLTSFGSLLQSDSPDSLRSTVISMTGISSPAWAHLLYSIRTGKAAFDEAFQMSMYDYLGQNAEEAIYFNKWMEESAREWIVPFLDMLNLSQTKTVVDVGGGTGMLVSMILKKHPGLQAIVFDQEHIAEKARKALESAGVAERSQFVGGDFFDSVQAGGDLYILSRVLFNWDDEHALKLLKNCRAAMSPSAKLLIMDIILPNKKANAFSLLASMRLLVFGGNLMRTEKEYRYLLDKANFHSSGLIQTGELVSFIEATPR